ncbi:MAG: putative phosphoribosyl transferase [Actinomycetota bacterium]|jgi:predicted phosphoribosyltransferase|nr:putative phosphoribosyl transferase [Actinomycetota bacterium]
MRWATRSAAATSAPGYSCGGCRPDRTNPPPGRRTLTPTAEPYRDRADAGLRLAAELDPTWHGRPDVVVLGIPRGGVPVAFEVARTLGVPLDVFVVRKLGFPGHEELAFGAVASGGLRVLNPDVAALLPPRLVAEVTAREQEELDRRETAYRDGRPPLDLSGRTVVLVDDGLATGASMRAAVAAVRQQEPASVVVAVPVGAASTCRLLEGEADAVVCPMTPDSFVAVGAWYDDFSPTTDDEVRRLLAAARAPRDGGG